MPNGVDVASLTTGDRVKTLEGSIGQVIKPSDDGKWVLVRYLVATDRAIVGTEDLCSDEDLLEVLGPPSDGVE